MKISIGDIIDRYTICMLKTERGGIDNEIEMNNLWTELSKYKFYDTYIRRLYTVNSQIWNLETDIRNFKDELYSFEEIGKRAIEIRNLNSIRIEIKNEINSIFNEGYNEIKINHVSEKQPSVVITLTTVPDRLNSQKIEPVIISLCEQNDDDYEVHLNMPYVYNITNERYKTHNWLNQIKKRYSHFKIFRTEDFGPPTKIIPTIRRITNPETIFIVVDDDHTYDKDMVSEHRKYQEILPDSALCYHGKNDVNRLTRIVGDICVTEPNKVSYLLHYMSASYKKKLFNDDFDKLYVGRTLSDDILISRYMTDHDISIYVIPYVKNEYLYETYELWKKNEGSITFPITSCVHKFENSGCNHPDMLKIQPRFHHPRDLGKKNLRLI